MSIEDIFKDYGLRIQPYYDKSVLINTAHNTILPEIIFDNIELFIGNYFIINNDGLYGLYDFLGNCVLECKYSIIEHCSNEIFIVCDAYNYFGVINSVGNRLIDLKYSGIEKIDDNRLAVYDQSRNCALFSITGDQLTAFSYLNIEPWRDTLYMVDRYTDEMGIINALGHKILPRKFDTIDLCNGFFKVSTFEFNEYGPNKIEFGLYSCDGKEIIPCKYKDIIVEADYILAVEERRTDRWPLGHYEKIYGVFSKLGKQLAPCIYSKIEYSAKSHIFTLSENSSSPNVYIDEEGRHCLFVDGLYLPFNNITFPELLKNGLIKGIGVKSGKYGIISMTGKILINFNYGDIFPISDNIFICRSCRYKSNLNQGEKDHYTYDVVSLNSESSEVLHKDLDDFKKIIAYIYQKPDVVSSEIFSIKLETDGMYNRLMLNTGEIVTPYPVKVGPFIYRVDLIPFRSFAQWNINHGKVGFYNVPKKCLVEPQYDDIKFNPFTNRQSYEFSLDSKWLQCNSDNLVAIVKINELYGAIDESGRLIIPTQYDTMKFIKNGIYAEASGYAYMFSTKGINTKKYRISEDELLRREWEAEAADRDAARQYEADLKDELDDIINNGGDWILDN